jgi:AcrR family transcriptional regulator
MFQDNAPGASSPVLTEKSSTEILDASARVFAQIGYFQAGINEICLEAGISNGALYKYFEHKKGLFITVAQRSIDPLQMAFGRMASGQLDFWQRMQPMLENVAPLLTLYEDYFSVYMDWGSPVVDAFAVELSDAFERQSFESFYDLVEEAQEWKRT